MIYFGYCTLLDVPEMRRLCPGARPLGIAQLPGFELCFSAFAGDSEAGGCDLKVRDGGVMWGLLYEMVSGEYAELDVMAGVGEGHLERIDVQVSTEDGASVAATTYRNPAPSGPFRPSAAYTAPILAGAEALGLPGPYFAELEAIIAASQQ